MARNTFGDVAAEAAANDTSGGGGGTPPPAGTYTATVTSGNTVPTKAGDRYRLRLRCQVDSGPHAGSVVWLSQMLDPDTQVSVRIFTRMCEAFGMNTAEQLGSLPVDTAEDVRELLEVVRRHAEGRRVQIKTQERNNYMEVRYVDPLPDNAAPSQLGASSEQKSAAASGMAKVASAAKKPARPAL